MAGGRCFLPEDGAHVEESDALGHCDRERGEEFGFEKKKGGESGLLVTKEE